MTPMGSEILDALIRLYSTFQLVNSLWQKIGAFRSPVYDVDALIRKYHEDAFQIGDEVKVSGLYSDFIPLANVNTMGMLNQFPLSFKSSEVGGTYGGVLHRSTCVMSCDPVSIPFFYKNETPRPTGDLTGYGVEMSGKIISIPSSWDGILSIGLPFGIQVSKIDLVGMPSPAFGIFPWQFTDYSYMQDGEGHDLNSGGSCTDSSGRGYVVHCFEIGGVKKLLRFFINDSNLSRPRNAGKINLFLGGFRNDGKLLELPPKDELGAYNILMNPFNYLDTENKAFIEHINTSLGSESNLDLHFDQRARVKQTPWLEQELSSRDISIK